MEIHIARNGQEMGIFDADALPAKVMTGELRPTDLAWAEGLTEWLPLQRLMEVLELEMPGAARRPGMAADRYGRPRGAVNSGLATTSMVMGIVLAVLWVLMIGGAVAAGIDENAKPEEAPALMMLGCGFLLAMLANLIGGILGIVAASQNISNKGAAITGIVLNFGALAMVGFLMVLGMSMQ